MPDRQVDWLSDYHFLTGYSTVLGDQQVKKMDLTTACYDRAGARSTGQRYAKPIYFAAGCSKARKIIDRINNPKKVS